MFQSGSSSDFPTITLSACEDDSDEDDDEGFVQRDSVIQVGQVRNSIIMENLNFSSSEQKLSTQTSDKSIRPDI